MDGARPTKAEPMTGNFSRRAVAGQRPLELDAQGRAGPEVAAPVAQRVAEQVLGPDVQEPDGVQHARLGAGGVGPAAEPEDEHGVAGLVVRHQEAVGASTFSSKPSPKPAP